MLKPNLSLYDAVYYQRNEWPVATSTDFRFYDIFCFVPDYAVPLYDKQPFMWVDRNWNGCAYQK